MNDTEHQLHHALCTVEPPEGLYSKVFSYITLREQRAARVRAFFLGMLTVFSAVVLVPAVQYVGAELYASGFYEFVSIAFSSHTVFLSAWRELTLSMLESLPSVALLVLAAVGASLVWSLTRAVSNVRVGFLAVQRW